MQMHHEQKRMYNDVPKEFSSKHDHDETGHPMCRRRNDGGLVVPPIVALTYY